MSGATGTAAWRDAAKHSTLTVCAAFLAITVLAVGLRWHNPHRFEMLGTDEADYVRAMSYGLTANYLGSHERSGVEFVRGVVQEYQQTGWARPFKRDWDAGDAAALRHYHPPLGMYGVAGFLHAGVRDEAMLRVVPLLIGTLACLAGAFLTFVLLADIPYGLRLTMTIAAGVVAAASPYLVEVSTEIGPHAAFTLVSTLALVSLTLAAQRSDARWWTAACGFTGLSALTVPYSALLVLPLLWVWWSGRFAGARSLRLLAWGIAVALLVATAAWPPFLLRAGLVKPALMFGSILAKPLVDTWRPGAWIPALFTSHGALTALAILGLLAAPIMSREKWRVLAPTLMFIGALVLVNLRVGHMKPLYAGDLVIPLAALASALTGAALARFVPQVAVPVTLTVCLLAPSTSVSPPLHDGNWRTSLQSLNDRFAGARLLVTPRPAGAMVTYYLDRATVVLDSGDAGDRAELERALASGQIDAILRWGVFAEPGGAAASSIAARTPDGTATTDVALISWWRPVETSPSR